MLSRALDLESEGRVSLSTRSGTVPLENRAIRGTGEISAEIVKEYGALRVVMLVGRVWIGRFVLPRQGHGELRITKLVEPQVQPRTRPRLSYIEWPDKAAGDAGMEKVTSDHACSSRSPPALAGRFIAGGSAQLDQAPRAIPPPTDVQPARGRRPYVERLYASSASPHSRDEPQTIAE